MLHKLSLFLLLLLLGIANAADDSSSYWVASIQRQGVVPFGNNTNYKIFRNVKDYGAKG